MKGSIDVEEDIIRKKIGTIRDINGHVDDVSYYVNHPTDKGNQDKDDQEDLGFIPEKYNMTLFMNYHSHR